MSAFATPRTMPDLGTEEEESLTVQHGVVVRTSEHLRKLNELLAAGWRVIHSTPYEQGSALLIIEAHGDQAAVAEFRQVFGAPAGTA